MNRRPPRFGGNTRGARVACCVCVLALCLSSIGTGIAAPADPGRLFFTPAQRAQLEDARARDVTQSSPGQQTSSASAPVLLRYDGMVIRSDGRTTRWIDGKVRRDGAAVSGLKPGQIRADGKVYEPYQVLRPTPSNPAKSDIKETAP